MSSATTECADDVLERAGRFPDTRFMGSKQKLLGFLFGVLCRLEFDTCLDACSGSGVVSYLLKVMGKQVQANDHLEFCYHFANATVANSSVRLRADDLRRWGRDGQSTRPGFIETTYASRFFDRPTRAFLDRVCARLRRVRSDKRQSLALAALCRACLKRQPRGVFTFVGRRYDDGRPDLQKPLAEHWAESAELLNACVFDNGRENTATCRDVFEIEPDDYDLVYLDPPYLSPHSDNEYTRRYHFLEGLCSYWDPRRVQVQWATKTRKIKARPTPFGSPRTIHRAFADFFARFERSTIVVSYSSNGIPGIGELSRLLRRFKPKVKVHRHPHVYSFGTHRHKRNNRNNRPTEYLLVGC